MLKEPEAAIGCVLLDNCESKKWKLVRSGSYVNLKKKTEKKPQILRLLTLKQITIFERFSWFTTTSTY